MRPRTVLFLCTGNSARSILAEAILERAGAGRFHAFSAGSQPKGKVHPMSLAVLRSLGYDTARFRSKSWDEFAGPDAAPLDLIITVCDSAAGEVCPIWPGHPLTAHWGIPDPAAVQGSEAEVRAAFLEAYRSMQERIERLLALPFEQLDANALKAHLMAIGRDAEGATARTSGTAP